MKYSTIFILIVLTRMMAYGQDHSIFGEFKDPGREYSIIPLWSWNGTLKSEELKRQIDLMIEKGVYGAFMHARAGIESCETPYFSEGWWKAMDSTIVHAHRNNFEAWIYDEDKWPSGSAGGRTIAADPGEFIKKGLHYTTTQLKEGDTYLLDKQGKLKIFAVKMTGEKRFDPASKIDLTSYQSGQWKVPPGTWTILAFDLVTDHRVYPVTQIDYLDEKAVRKFVDITYEEYYKRYAKYFGNTIPGAFFDEIYFKVGPDNILPWSDDFAESFNKRKGYDILNELPSLVLPCSGSESLNYDYFDELTTRYDLSWFKQIAGWCEKHGIGLTGHTEETFESYKGEGDYIKTIGQLQFPGTDNEDFRYNFPRYIQWYKPKQLSSAAHIYGKSRSAAEAMGGGGYIITPEEYRYGMARLGVFGINFFIPHLFHYTVDNLQAYRDWPPSWFFLNPYWKYFKPLADYGSRISYMNRQGSHICHVALLNPITEQWSGGFTGKPDARDYNAVQEILLNNQIDYDVINDDALLKSDCSSGNIRLFDESYHVLILPSVSTLTYDVSKKIADFCDKGGIVIATTRIPFSSVHGNDDSVNTLMYGIFGIKPKLAGKYYDAEPGVFTPFTSNINPQSGGGFYVKNMLHLPSVARKHIVNELQIMEGEPSVLRFHQRRKDNVTYYLMMNEERKVNHFQVLVPDYGIPFKLDPETGEAKKIDNYLNVGEQLLISMDFQPWEAFFLTFVPGKKEQKEMMIASASLADAKLRISNGEQILSGWAEPGIKHVVEIQNNTGAKSESRYENILPLTSYNLEGNWKFQVVKNQLDQKWSDHISQDTIAIPVMKFYANHDNRNWDFTSAGFNDQHLPEIKIADRFGDQKGAVRYLSPWNASRIIYYDRGNHVSTMEGQNASFRKIFKLQRVPSEANIKITAEPSYTVFVNGTKVGADAILQSVETYDIAPYLNVNNNEIIVKVPHQQGLIMEGVIETGQDFILLHTDDSWEAEIDGLWEPALIHSKPSLGDWQKIDFGMKDLKFPLTCWYRQKLPVGATQLILPERQGSFEYYVNGKRMKERGGKVELPDLPGSQPAVLAVKAIIQRAEAGLLAPVRVVCKEAEVPLVPWKNLGLSWYSGRAIYKKDFLLPAGFNAKNVKIILDPGELKWFAEIWVNEQMVKFSPWGSYRTDISKYLRKGKNSLSLVVSNLKANEAFWDVPDALVEESYNRWWQQGATLREKERLESGLLGPVSIIPIQYVEWKYPVQKF